MPTIKRLPFALKASGWHLLASALFAALSAAFIFFFWYPFPYDQMAGGSHLFWILIAVDAVCGPLLTLVLFNPAKPRNEWARDLTLIVLIQLAAFGYGLHTLAQARPLALVFEVDRFRAVSQADLDPSELDKDAPSKIPVWLHPWSFSSARVMGLRAPQGSTELMQSIELSIAGIEPSQRPSQWQDYALSVPQVLQRARPLDDLRAKHPNQTTLIDAAAAQALANAASNETTDPTTLRWLPLVSHRATDWVVLLDPVTARARGYVHLDGF